ncbi:UDP-3-O-(3-hydroxymyristoyl)glucosamine N-acyltransferase [Haliovirga abyssi]|uniref:UDP-3-O-acylglucosamine N-acyltransferase n=1 Tax=Haliovirga abyssi TaxID=2996794 RepID=A0AAU9D9P9_9FUSO|nr:UDP-3-O-(3-hydroxymyristoyl)glucosamine N-acyltransferase [Haliovirga abyssi]BDU50316.1 UDP-3-O-acylglucosamine N-acyltransferase [Haliovirga abyssi]
MYSVEEIAKLIDGKIIGDKNFKVEGLAPFYESKENKITFALDEKFLKNLNKTLSKAIIIPEGIITEFDNNKIYILVDKSPKEKLMKILKFFKKEQKEIEKNIEEDLNIYVNVKISPNCYIGHNVKIGENSIIYPNVTILEGVTIGKNSIIYPNVTIREFCKIGDNVIIQPGAVIGSDGFGYIPLNGMHQKLEQIGSVIIEDNVEIGSNTTIDRGAIGDTIIKKGTKIDNLVHIAHNDKIGENCLIIAQVGISGSVEVGDNTILAGQTGVAGHLKIGSNVVIAAKSGVTNNVPDNSRMAGFPLRAHKDDLRVKVAMGKVPSLIKQIKKLEKKLEEK